MRVKHKEGTKQEIEQRKFDKAQEEEATKGRLEAERAAKAKPADAAKPAKPERGKTLPHLWWNKVVISSSESRWLISSGQELSAYIVF